MAALGHRRAAADLRGWQISGFVAWWIRRTYYLFQMPRWDTRLRIAFDWTVSLFSRPDLTKVDLAPEREQERRNRAAGATVSAQATIEPLGRVATPASAPQDREAVLVASRDDRPTLS
jgi:hypothetical protein